MKYILMLGGSGFIGSNLVCEYLKYDKNIIIYGETSFRNIELGNFDGKLITVNGSLSDLALLESVFRNYEIEIVVHLVSSLGPSSSLEDYILDYDNVVLPTLSLLETMKKFKVRDLVFLSSGGTIYGDYKSDGLYSEEDPLNPISYYGLSKLHIEALIKLEARKKSIDYLIVRPSNPFGKFQNIHGKQGLISVILGKIIDGETLEVWGDGNIKRDYIPIEYLCSTIAKLTKLKIKNETFNIGSGTSHSINEIIQIVENSTGIRVKTQYYAPRNVDVNSVILNARKLSSVIDIEPINLEQSIAEYYKTILEIKNDK